MKKIFAEKKSATLISDRIERRYFTGFDIMDGMMLVADDKKYYFTDDRYFYAVKEKLAERGVHPLRYDGIKSVQDKIVELGIEKLYLDFSRITASEYLNYKTWGVEIKDFENEITLLRSTKADDEIEKIKKACAITQNAYHTVIKTLKVGDTEIDVKKRLEKAMLDNGANGLAFDTIVAFGENSAIPHHVTGQTMLKKDSVVLIDMGCTFDGYCSDITRTAFYGTPTSTFIVHYDAVLEANEKAEREIYHGILTDEADGIARNYLKEKGLDGLFTHSLGHGVGLEIHEYPSLSSKKQDQLHNGMVFSVEPGVYINGQYGIRIEDTVVLKEGKIERLFTDDKKLMIL